MAIIEFIDVSFQYAGSHEKAIDHLQFQIEPGQWIIVCGPSGCGKSTLAKLLKPELLPQGIQSGEIRIDQRLITTLSTYEHASQIAWLHQHAEQFFVMDRVQEEVVFSMENLGIKPIVMRRRLAEIAQFMDMESWLEQSTDHLSGGQAQFVALASVLLTEPRILVLDEPLAHLDPLACERIVSFLRKLQQEFGITIFMMTHRLDEVWAYADDIWFMDQGSITCRRSDCLQGSLLQSPLFAYAPESIKLMVQLGLEHGIGSFSELQASLSTCSWIESDSPKQSRLDTLSTHQKLIEFQDVRFRYSSQQKWVCNQLSLAVREAEIYAIMGANGSGKSTILQLMAGHIQPQSGRILRAKQLEIGYVAQQPMYHFLEETVEAVLLTRKSNVHHLGMEIDILQWAEKFGLTHRLQAHPYDLSGGEKQRLALACACMGNPRIILLDEPTKGLDPIHKQKLKEHLLAYHRQGITIVITTHDLEFVADWVHHCIFIFEGSVAADEDAQAFFTSNLYYTTPIHRLVRKFAPSAIHREAVLARCKRK